MARTFRIIVKSLGGLAAAAAVFAMSAPAQARDHGSHGRPPPHAHARPMPHHYHRPPPPAYHGRYHGGYHGHYRGGSDDGDGLLFGMALGAIAGAVIAGSAVQAPPPVVYSSPPPPVPPLYSGY